MFGSRGLHSIRQVTQPGDWHTQPAQRFDVDGPDKTCADDAGAEVMN